MEDRTFTLHQRLACLSLLLLVFVLPGFAQVVANHLGASVLA